MDKQGWILAEYRSLRQEISEFKNVRMVALGFTLAFVGGVIAQISTGNGTPAAGACLLVVATALGLSVHCTRGIDNAGGYLRRYIEPEFMGLGWETRFQRYRLHRTRFGVLGGGFSKPLALTYVSVVAAVDWDWLSFGRTVGADGVAMALLTGGCLALAGDLYLRRTSGWKMDWSLWDGESEPTSNGNP